MKQLIHKGILIPTYESKGFSIIVRGKKVRLNPKQEEIAVAWVKKQGTVYVEDNLFVENFFKDFSNALGPSADYKREDIDFSEIQKAVDEEKAKKLNMPKEEKKKLAADRKAKREKNKEDYGYATLDGNKVELGNYVGEPSSIFMGRGEHPLRGRWKEGPSQEDVTLNLSPDATRPEGSWKETVWQSDSMWIAKWDDKLSHKVKYIWLADTVSVKQEREKRKFDLANKLETRFGKLKDHIEKNLVSGDAMRRKVATVCYLINELKIRVGDEKAKDEADTVGATTLRPEHVKIIDNTHVNFDFLGKDSVRWVRNVELKEQVVSNIREFIAAATSPIFEGVKSDNVRRFLSDVLPGLTAKVFRTFHGSRIVRKYLDESAVTKDDAPIKKKYEATTANLRAAEELNHKRQLPKNWDQSLAKKKETLNALRQKDDERSKKHARELDLKIDLMTKTCNYNLRTSLKSYIDPRIYYNWGKKVDYDWKLYYPKTFQRKFSWVEKS
ncbi:MAG: DNA topoisomerase I [Promethearchaeati archaeon SRVP18_Atabeyarchaeia-1]